MVMKEFFAKVHGLTGHESCLSAKQSYFTENRDHHRKTYLDTMYISMKLGKTNASEYIMIMTPASIAHGKFEKRKQKDCKTQNTRKYAVKHSFLVIAT